MQFGAHVSAAGGIDTAIDRAAAIKADCVQVFTQSPRMWKHTVHSPESIERFKARRAEAKIGGVVCHALYLCNLGATDRDVYEKSVTAMSATVDTAVAIEADGVIFHVGSHLGGGLDAAMKQIVRAMKKILEALQGRHVAADGELRRHGRHDRALDPRARAARRRARRARAARHLPRLVPPLRLRLRRDRPAPRSTPSSTRSTRRSASTACARCTSTTAQTPLGSNRDRHADVLKGEMGKGIGVFLAHPAFQDLAAYLETPGPDGHGAVKADLTRVRPAPQDGARRARS